MQLGADSYCTLFQQPAPPYFRNKTIFTRRQLDPEVRTTLQNHQTPFRTGPHMHTCTHAGGRRRADGLVHSPHWLNTEIYVSFVRLYFCFLVVITNKWIWKQAISRSSPWWIVQIPPSWDADALGVIWQFLYGGIFSVVDSFRGIKTAREQKRTDQFPTNVSSDKCPSGPGIIFPPNLCSYSVFILFFFF